MVNLSLCEVADSPFYIQGDDIHRNSFQKAPERGSLCFSSIFHQKSDTRHTKPSSTVVGIKCGANDGLMLGHCILRWPIIIPALVQRLVFSSHANRSKDNPLNQRCINVGQPFTMLDQN